MKYGQREWLPLPARFLCQEVVVAVGEVVLGTGAAAQGFAVSDFLKVVQAAGDAAVAVAGEGVQRDAGPAVYAAVDFAALQDRITGRVHDTRRGRAVRVDEHAAGVVGIFIMTKTDMSGIP